MSAETDFNLTLDRAAGLLLDATCACRAAARDGLPGRQRSHLRAAIVRLEGAQTELFNARNEPWQPAPPPQRDRQLELHAS